MFLFHTEKRLWVCLTRFHTIESLTDSHTPLWVSELLGIYEIKSILFSDNPKTQKLSQTDPQFLLSAHMCIPEPR